MIRHELDEPLDPDPLTALELASLQAIQAAIDEGRDDVVTQWVKREPDLFVKLLDGHFGPQLLTWSKRDSTSIRHGIYGTLAMTLADKGFVDAVHALLAAGIHPDDPRVFCRQPLICYPSWRSTPRNLAQALLHGADPRPLALDAIDVNPSQYTGKPRILSFPANQKACALLLIVAGAREFDPPCNAIELLDELSHGDPEACALALEVQMGLLMREQLMTDCKPTVGEGTKRPAQRRARL